MSSYTCLIAFLRYRVVIIIKDCQSIFDNMFVYFEFGELYEFPKWWSTERRGSSYNILAQVTIGLCWMNSWNLTPCIPVTNVKNFMQQVFPW